MTRQQFLLILFVLLIMGGILNSISKKPNDKIIAYAAPSPDVIQMPLVQDIDPVTSILHWGAPQEDRGTEYRRYLAASIKISVKGASGSGSIVYYNPDTKEAYVASCGHLWSGSKNAESLKNSPLSCKVIVWYQNNVKLDNPKEYPAQVLFWSNERGYDSSLIKFTPDWIPEYFPIAQLEYPLPAGLHLHSCGCDGGREVARYDVEVVGMRGSDLITTRNSPRPGRSGGGLFSPDGFYVGTCWGTSDTSGGSGIGYFTPLKSIHSVYSKNGYDWLLNVNVGMAQTIPIIDFQGNKIGLPPEAIVGPGKDSFHIPRF